jgi:hypothetical protein
MGPFKVTKECIVFRATNIFSHNIFSDHVDNYVVFRSTFDGLYRRYAARKKTNYAPKIRRKRIKFD